MAARKDDVSIEMSASCFDNPQNMLAEAFHSKNTAKFRKAFNLGANAELVDPKVHLSLFEKICKTYGSGEFIKICIENGVDVNKTNTHLLNKKPINFVAESLSFDNLNALLQASNSVDLNHMVNALTPLHKFIVSLNDENADEIYKCVELLTKFKADINLANQQSVTPILSLLKLKRVSKREPIIKLLLDQPSIDLDTLRESEARKLLEKNFPHLKLKQPSAETGKGFDALVELLDNGDENRFCESLLENLDDNPKLIYESNARGTLLQIAIQNGMTHSSQVLIENGANVNSGDRKCPAKLACYHGEWEILTSLLRKENIQLNFQKDEPLLCIIVKKLGEYEVRKTCDYFKCFKVLIEDPRVDVHEVDETGSCALYYAVKYKNEWASELLLQKGAFIGLENRFKEIPILDIQSRILEKYFNSCITVNELRPGDNDFEVRFDYSCFVPAEVRNKKDVVTFAEEMVPVEYIAQSPELKHLMKHPLISSFLFLKWHRLGPLFYTNLVLYSFFCLSLILYLVFCYGHDVSAEVAIILRCCSSFGILYVALREIFQFFTSPCVYFKNLENYVEIFLIFMSIIVVCGTEFDEAVRRVIASVTILLVALEFSVLVGALPILSFSTHMVMLKTVSISLLRSLTFYSIIIVSFGLCFYTLLGGGSSTSIQGDNSTTATNATDFNKFENPGTAILKTIVMMTGEFEAADIEFYTNAISYLIFLLFVFFISIVLFNLLNGLAVSDTAAIKSEAELLGLISRAQLLSRFEKMVLRGENFCNRLILQNFLINRLTKNRICLFPQLLPLNMIAVLPNANNKINIPVSAEPATDHRKFALNRGLSQENLIEPVSEVKILEQKSFFVVKPLVCCLFYANCSRMDPKVMKYSREVLNRRKEEAEKVNEKKVLTERLSRLEFKIDQLLNYIRIQNESK